MHFLAIYAYCTAESASPRAFQRSKDRLQRTTLSRSSPRRTRVGVGCGGSRVGWGWGCCCCAGGRRWCREAPGGRWRASAGLGPPQGPSGAALHRLSGRVGCASRRPGVLPSPGQQQQRLVGVATVRHRFLREHRCRTRGRDAPKTPLPHAGLLCTSRLVEHVLTTNTSPT